MTPTPITPAAFAPFGALIDVGGGVDFMINEGSAGRCDNIAEVDVSDKGGTPYVSIFRATKRPFPIKVDMMERHPLGSQMFLPIQDKPWLVVVASGDEPSADSCQAFLVSGHQAIQFHKNTWHFPLLIMAESQDFWVIDRSGPGNNLDEYMFKGDAAILTLPALSA